MQQSVVEDEVRHFNALVNGLSDAKGPIQEARGRNFC